MQPAGRVAVDVHVLPDDGHKYPGLSKGLVNDVLHLRLCCGAQKDGMGLGGRASDIANCLNDILDYTVAKAKVLSNSRAVDLAARPTPARRAATQSTPVCLILWGLLPVVHDLAAPQEAQDLPRVGLLQCQDQALVEQDAEALQEEICPVRDRRGIWVVLVAARDPMVMLHGDVSEHSPQKQSGGVHAAQLLQIVRA